MILCVASPAVAQAPPDDQYCDVAGVQYGDCDGTDVIVVPPADRPDNPPIAPAPGNDVSDVSDVGDLIEFDLPVIPSIPQTPSVSSVSPEEAPLTITEVTQPEAGRGTVEILDGEIVYTPDADYSGRVTFTYTVSDGNGGTDTATITVDVTGTNDDPIAVNDAASATEGGRPVEIDVTGNDRIAPDTGETLTIEDFTQPPDGQGTVELVDGVLVYTPDANYEGETSFEYTISDGNGGTRRE